MNARVIDMTGKKYGSITALSIAGKSVSGDLKWLFICDCGKRFDATGCYARTGKITTCPECAKERVRLASVIHGKSETKEYFTWTDIKTRCYNPKTKYFNNYGGRGIVVCDRWLESFENFLSDMGVKPSVKHTIERKDNNGNYEPSNCYWATYTEQANNKRNNIKVTIDGETKTISRWASENGLSYSTVYQRHRDGNHDDQLTASRENFLRPKSTGSVELNGITDTYAGWSQRTGIKASTIAMRIRYGWSVEKSLTKGALPC